MNKQTNKDGTYKEVYYYVCSRKRVVTGRSCTYKAVLKKTIIEPLVIEAIRELLSNERFAKEIKARIGTQIDTTTIDKEMKNDEERKSLVSSLIKQIQIYPRGETEVPLKAISFNFPVYKDGQGSTGIFVGQRHAR